MRLPTARMKRAYSERNSVMTFSEGFDLIRWARKRQEGQTMAEYAVVLGVITLAVVGVFTALAGGVSGAISTVTSRI
jgi:Flp pilus assembly pilin Flp